MTPVDAARYRLIREEVQEELPPAKSDPVKVAIAKLRAIREAYGVTLGELAARTGMTRGNVSRRESQKDATLPTLNCYARALGCKLENDGVAVNVIMQKAARAIR